MSFRTAVGLDLPPKPATRGQQGGGCLEHNNEDGRGEGKHAAPCSCCSRFLEIFGNNLAKNMQQRSKLKCPEPGLIHLSISFLLFTSSLLDYTKCWLATALRCAQQCCTWVRSYLLAAHNDGSDSISPSSTTGK